MRPHARAARKTWEERRNAMKKTLKIILIVVLALALLAAGAVWYLSLIHI